MKASYSYNQFSKKVVRHQVLLYAIELLTSKRSEAACVSRNYVRKIYDYFTLSDEESNNKQQALKINQEHLRNWESLHDSNIGVKRPQDLTVCYLCGPEPQNDFAEMVALGVLPQNIWAFETDKSTYKNALKSFEENVIPQPHILKQNIETFFSNTPKKFDIIYIDACGSIPSEQHALRCVTSACLNHRLYSPGVIISNFSEPDSKSEYFDMIQDYLFSKSNLGMVCKLDDWNNTKGSNFITSENFSDRYGEFVSCLLRDIPGIIVPLQRLWKNPYLEQIIKKDQVLSFKIDKQQFDSIKNYSIGKYFLLTEITGKKDCKKEQLKLDLMNYDDFLNGLKTVLCLQKESERILKDDIKNLKNTFENNTMYQFLDKHHSNLLFDLIINQLAYPLHCNTSSCKRFTYKAKSNQMFTDVTVYDECRYIYDWLPSIHQIESMYKNDSWQYIFRFALDGLVKSRKKYNNEFFFKVLLFQKMNKALKRKKYRTG